MKCLTTAHLFLVSCKPVGVWAHCVSCHRNEEKKSFKEPISQSQVIRGSHFELWENVIHIYIMLIIIRCRVIYCWTVTFVLYYTPVRSCPILRKPNHRKQLDIFCLLFMTFAKFDLFPPQNKLSISHCKEQHCFVLIHEHKQVIRWALGILNNRCPHKRVQSWSSIPLQWVRNIWFDKVPLSLCLCSSPLIVFVLKWEAELV